MTISAAKIKAICTREETALVRASRKPELDKLSKAEIKRLAVRARKLHDKWQGLGRGQSRSKRRAVGTSGVDPNTRLKAQIFREAIERFESQLKAPVARSAAKGPRPKTKKQRSGE